MASRPAAYTGPYPIRSHRTQAEIDADNRSLLRRLEWARRDCARLEREAMARGIL